MVSIKVALSLSPTAGVANEKMRSLIEGIETRPLFLYASLCVIISALKITPLAQAQTLFSVILMQDDSEMLPL